MKVVIVEMYVYSKQTFLRVEMRITITRNKFRTYSFDVSSFRD